MAVSTRDKKTKANLKERISNIYENTKFTFRNSGKKNTQAVPTIVYTNNDPQEEYDEVIVSTCNQKKPSSTSRKKSKPNSYSSWNDRKTGCSNTSVKGVYDNAQRDSVQLPQHASKLPPQVTIKWKFFSIIALIVCICLITVLVSLIILIVQQKVSPCEGLGCLYNGSCSVADDEIVCHCLDGFFGEKCEVTPCERVKCENGGECFIQNLKPKCFCRNGFSGDNCHVTPCASEPCLHGGVCMYTTDNPNYNCTCPDGFSGSNCEVTPCTSSPCKNNSTCSVNGSTYRCRCQHGYSGSQCQETPCSTLRCRNQGTCIESNGVFKCNCTVGYTGKLCQDNVCDLDNDLNCIFTQDTNDDYDWTRHSGSTLSSNTGPSSAYEGTYYFYFETSNPVVIGGVARLTTKPVKLSSNGHDGCLKFYYHMYGTGMGRLNVYQDISQIWTRNGNQGNSWKYALVRLNPSEATEVTFEAIRGANYTSDIAIDKVQILTSSC